MGLGEGERGDDERARPVVHPGRVPGRHRAALLERGLQGGQRLDGCVLARALVLVHHRGTLLPRKLDGHDLGPEATRLLRRDGLLVARQREPILVLARHAGLLRGVLRELPHVAVRERVPQPVVNHPVHELAVPRLDPGAHPIQVVRRVGHRLHAAGHDALLVPGADRLGREHDGLEPRAADLVDRERWDSAGQARVDRGLARRRLTRAPLEHVAHDHFVHVVGLDAGAAHGFADGERAQARRGQRGQPAQVLPDGRATGAENDGGGGVAGHLSQTNGLKLRVRTSSCNRRTNSSTGRITCFLPSPRARTATVPACASRSPTTAM